MKKNRRDFIRKVGALGMMAGLAKLSITNAHASSFGSRDNGLTGAEEIGYAQQPLPYGYAALEPAIDALTMEIHYTKHAAGYTKNLADACLAEKVDTGSTTLVKLLSKISGYSTKMRNNGGGHYNHEFFWRSMQAPVANGVNLPAGELATALIREFGSIDNSQAQFTDAAKNRFGSGWAWLVKLSDGKLKIGSTPNQDNPLMDLSELKGTPLLGIDVWEHAYYLKYQNKRPDYIKSWWTLVNWAIIEERYKKA
jgi:Fe-Mn family superoxide dismutase